MGMAARGAAGGNFRDRGDRVVAGREVEFLQRRALDAGLLRDGDTGAPRPMKMGTTASPSHYDAAAGQALQSANLREPAILRYASWAAFLLISECNEPIGLPTPGVT
jgi:hypothetical protein